MGSLDLSTRPSPAGDLRLSNEQLASAVVVAAAPLPALEMADGPFLAQILRMMDVLPRRADDTVGGKLRHRAYELTLGRYPRQALEFLVTEALRTSKFFPSTSECVEIMTGWQRDDHEVKEKLAARIAVRRERQARFDDTLARLARGECDQAEIDALDEWTKDVAETRGHLRREDDGAYPGSTTSTSLPRTRSRTRPARSRSG